MTPSKSRKSRPRSVRTEAPPLRPESDGGIGDEEDALALQLVEAGRERGGVVVLHRPVEAAGGEADRLDFLRAHRLSRAGTDRAAAFRRAVGEVRGSRSRSA